MRAFEDKMLRIVKQFFLPSGIASPQYKHQGFLSFIQQPYYLVSQLFPPLVVMGIGLMLPYSESRVQQQHPVFRPGYEASVVLRRYGNSQVGVKLFENILQ